MAKRFHPACLVLLTLGLACGALGEDLRVLPEKIDGGPAREMMKRYLLRRVEQAAERWRSEYEKRKTPEEVAAYQKRLREKFLEAIGGLPERSPLEARVTGTLPCDGYRIEKVIFESQPKHFVTANLYVPEAKQFAPPYPGVIVPCGHAMKAKAHDEYQSIGALLALSGMAALVFDPIDQGERGQYLGEGGWPKLWGTRAHTMVGVGCILLGRNTARFEIWDTMRAIDYLQSRPEVDPKRIGCTGNSGGGTQTSYTMALDDRVAAAAPSCYLTSMPALLNTIGPQDAEQNIFGQLAFGMDHADYLMMRAPTPILICAATKDFFDINGTWDSFRYAKRLYTRLGVPEAVDLLENDAGHNYNATQREGVARWMARWLLKRDLPITEPPLKRFTDTQLQCTPDGMVMRLPGARSVYDLNEDCERELAKRRAELWAGPDRAVVLAKVAQLAGIRRLEDLPQPQVEKRESLKRDGYQIDRLVLKPEEGILLPALRFASDKPPSGRTVLYLHQDGAAADAQPGGPIERLVRSGDVVLAVDLRGTGQTGPAEPRGSGIEGGPDWKDVYMAYLLGRSYVGMRAEDVLVAARWAAASAPAGTSGAVHLVAVGHVSVPALHAAALEPAWFASARLTRMLASWSSVIRGRLLQDQLVNAVHGALTTYDLADLAASLGNKLTIVEPVDAMGRPVEVTGP
jgi:cephalosporin-C deacetylase-like acetyl esterase